MVQGKLKLPMTAGRLEIDVETTLKAANDGDATSQCTMGAVYEYGMYGVKQDFAAAAKWYGKAAEQGYEMAKVFSEDPAFQIMLNPSPV